MKLFSSDKRKKLFGEKGNFVMKSKLVEIAKEVKSDLLPVAMFLFLIPFQ